MVTAGLGIIYSFNDLKKSPSPVSMGSVGSILNAAGFFKSSSTVGAVWIVRLPATIWHWAMFSKYVGMVGPSACPTEAGKPFIVPSGRFCQLIWAITTRLVAKVSAVIKDIV